MNVFQILISGLRITTPLLLAALGGIFNSQVGLMNIGIDGMMVLSGFSAALVGFHTQNIFLSVGSAVITGVAVGLIFAFFVVRLKANLIITGLAINILATGLSGYLLSVVFGVQGMFSSNKIPRLPGLGIKEFDVIVYLSWISILLVSFILYQTVFGLRLRSVGENKDAAMSLGINAHKYMYASYVISGVFAGFAGSHLVLSLQLFSKDITAGRGFIALAAILFGNSKPVPTALACMAFGLVESLQIRMQSTFEIPPQIIQMLPYIAVVAALWINSARKKGAIT